MHERKWVPEINKTLICVDSYHKGVPVGRLSSALTEMESFESMSQLLIKLDESLDDRQTPQSYTAPRTFSDLLGSMETDNSQFSLRRGQAATFEIVVLFRQHTSWQGLIYWQERKLEQSFRSVLELIRLMDSALRCEEGIGAA